MSLMFKIVFMAFIGIMLTSCSKTDQVSVEDVTVFPKPEDGYVGDPMPFYSNGVMNMFYLHDGRDGQVGFHPYNLMQTENFYSWQYQGTVIPFVNDLDSQDLALGTGSIIQSDDGVYHAFYTGHNYTGNMAYKEKIQHATSTDMLSWTKIEENGFFGGHHDFRDPYVRYIPEYNEYWMLITTRDKGIGVLKKYTSDNLVDWTDEGVFFINPIDENNMECATLIEFNDYWYLSFSTQGEGNERVLRYYFKKNLDDEWIVNERNYIDGIGFYAGRLEVFEDRLIASGWVGTKEADFDGGNFNWAGHLVNHELFQNEDGSLSAKMITEIDDILSSETKVDVYHELGGKYKSGQISFEGERDYETVVFDEYDGKTKKIDMVINTSNVDEFGFSFNVKQYYGEANINFNVKDSRIEFYNVSVQKKSEVMPQFFIEYDYPEELKIKAVIEGECMTFYLNEEIAFTTRVYEASGNKFGLYSTSKSSFEIAKFKTYSY